MIRQSRREHILGLATVAGLMGLPMRAFAADAPQPTLEGFTPAALAKLRATGGIPALGGARAADGGRAILVADGLRSLGAATPVTTNDLWHIGSITKSYTSTLVARLVEKGGISWDTSVGEVLGSTAPGMKDVYKPVTFRHLCSHHSGLPRGITNTEMVKFPVLNPADPRPDRLRYAALALADDPVAAPGEKMLYSNSGYVIAGAMLEVIYKQSWEKLLAAHVFKPLGQSSAGYGAPGTPGKLDQPLGHTLFGEPKTLTPVPLDRSDLPADLPAVLGPAGLVHMTLADMVKYLNAHLQMPASFLKPESWKTLHTPPYTENYAMGWVVRPGGEIWHNGSNNRWYAEVIVDFARKRVAFSACNDGDRTQSGPAVAALLKGAIDGV
ncbi:serine hydrolase domain-containing protein [Sphingomonas colocasiae]|uniref:Beta-lactamase family protein n=1 Tax=Sphingomonas colocasiae TaxID=1848973 RepID=A0ABS7PJU3_9SPHN|nr:serine hydrolase domain-containing protein [Sphingomonas colocasiae]MBY8821561.1 beta-lactamase family protein [Sphingomonas colocasiae]